MCSRGFVLLRLLTLARSRAIAKASHRTHKNRSDNWPLKYLNQRARVFFFLLVLFFCDIFFYCFSAVFLPTFVCVCVYAVLFYYRSSKSDDVPLYEETNNILNHLQNHVNQMQKVIVIAFERLWFFTYIQNNEKKWAFCVIPMPKFQFRRLNIMHNVMITTKSQAKPSIASNSNRKRTRWTKTSNSITKIQMIHKT